MKPTGLFLAFLLLAAGAVHACTIFVLTGPDRTLFCNNEDWSNPNTRIWFEPGGTPFPSGAATHGCGYVGFDDGWAQGGVNTEGLAFDWVAGFTEQWERLPGLKTVNGNSAQRMLETCATVEEAAAFFRKHWEPAFSHAKILVADRTGTSAIIGARDGRLEVAILRRSRGFGFAGRIVERMLAENPEPDPANAVRILRAALQEGQYATKYSNVFDLNTGDIFLYRFPEQDRAVRLSLNGELKRGRHSYDIPRIEEQLNGRSRPRRE
jgi:hypothetical protein